MDTDRPVLVLGATGATGRRVVNRLHAAGVAARAASRTSETLFDWSRPATWRSAVCGARAVYLVEQGSPGPDATGELARLAAAAGVATIVLLSSTETGLPGYEDHLDSERAVQSSGTEWTVLRSSWFAQNFMNHFGQEIGSGLLALPAGEGRVPFIDVEDIAAVAVAVLTQNGHTGKTYRLTGPHALSYSEAVQRISALTGLSVRYDAITEADYVEHLTARGVPDDVARVFATVHRAIADGRADRVSNDVQRVLNRPPRAFDCVVRAAVADGTWPTP